MRKKPTVTTITLKHNASFVHGVMYLLRTFAKMDTKIAVILGIVYGSICPIAAYVIFHHAVYHTAGLEKWALVLVGLAGVVISLSNVSALMRELTKSRNIGICYAILLEGTAMIMRGDRISQIIGLLALLTVVLANLLKTAYNSLLKTE